MCEYSFEISRSKFLINPTHFLFVTRFNRPRIQRSRSASGTQSRSPNGAAVARSRLRMVTNGNCLLSLICHNWNLFHWDLSYVFLDRLARKVQWLGYLFPCTLYLHWRFPLGFHRAAHFFLCYLLLYVIVSTYYWLDKPMNRSCLFLRVHIHIYKD